MQPHSDPTVLQSWLIAIPTLLTALSTWYLRRGTKKSHEATEVKTAEKLDSYNGAIKDKVDELEKAIEGLKKSVASSLGKTEDCQIRLAQKYTEQINALQQELVRARRIIEKYVPGQAQTQAGELGPGAPDAAEPPALQAGTKLFGEEKIVETPKTPVGKVKWEKGE